MTSIIASHYEGIVSESNVEVQDAWLNLLGYLAKHGICFLVLG